MNTCWYSTHEQSYCTGFFLRGIVAKTISNAIQDSVNIANRNTINSSDLHSNEAFSSLLLYYLFLLNWMTKGRFAFNEILRWSEMLLLIVGWRTSSFQRPLLEFVRFLGWSRTTLQLVPILFQERFHVW